MFLACGVFIGYAAFFVIFITVGLTLGVNLCDEHSRVGEVVSVGCTLLGALWGLWQAWLSPFGVRRQGGGARTSDSKVQPARFPSLFSPADLE